MEQTTLEKLNEKVLKLIAEHKRLQEEVLQLREESATFKMAQEEKDAEIVRLREENAMKDLEIEEIVNKIESILG